MRVNVEKIQHNFIQLLYWWHMYDLIYHSCLYQRWCDVSTPAEDFTPAQSLVKNCIQVSRLVEMTSQFRRKGYNGSNVCCHSAHAHNSTTEEIQQCEVQVAASTRAAALAAKAVKTPSSNCLFVCLSISVVYLMQIIFT